MKKKQFKFKEIICVLAICFFTIVAMAMYPKNSIQVTKAFSGVNVNLDSLNFPDSNFRNYIINNVFSGSTVVDSDDFLAIQELNLPAQNIADIQGIEYFRDLEVLNLNDNTLTTINVSNNTKLRELYLYNNQLNAIDIQSNVNLEHLDLGKNANIASLLTINNTKLKNLVVGSNQITSLDLSNNSEIEFLDVSNNSISNLNVSNLINLKVFYGYQNLFVDIDVRYNSMLRELSLGQNFLTQLDVTHNPRLTSLSSYRNAIEYLDVTNNPQLKFLYTQQNKLSELNLSNNLLLEQLDCSENQLSSLDITLLNSITSVVGMTQESNAKTYFDDGYWYVYINEFIASDLFAQLVVNNSVPETISYDATLGVVKYHDRTQLSDAPTTLLYDFDVIQSGSVQETMDVKLNLTPEVLNPVLVNDIKIIDSNGDGLASKGEKLNYKVILENAGNGSMSNLLVHSDLDEMMKYVDVLNSNQLKISVDGVETITNIAGLQSGINLNLKKNSKIEVSFDVKVKENINVNEVKAITHGTYIDNVYISCSILTRADKSEAPKISPSMDTPFEQKFDESKPSEKNTRDEIFYKKSSAYGETTVETKKKMQYEHDVDQEITTSSVLTNLNEHLDSILFGLSGLLALGAAFTFINHFLKQKR